MTDKDLIKEYKETYKTCSKNPTEKAKKIYINTFNAFDTKLNNDLTEYIEKLDKRPKDLNDEIERLGKIIDAVTYRLSLRNKMIKDYTRLMKYKPKKLKPIPLEDKLERLENNKKNLKSAKSIITELIISGKQIREYKKRKGFFEKKVASKIEELIPKRVKLIDLLRKSPEIMDDLYVFAIKAPFNEENGYINYLIVKSDPKNMIEKEN